MVSSMEEKTVLELQQELQKLKKAQARIKRKFTFLLSIIAMLVLITATLAWFTLSNFASVNEINLKISTAPELGGVRYRTFLQRFRHRTHELSCCS